MFQEGRCQLVRPDRVVTGKSSLDLVTWKLFLGARWEQFQGRGGERTKLKRECKLQG